MSGKSYYKNLILEIIVKVLYVVICCWYLLVGGRQMLNTTLKYIFMAIASLSLTSCNFNGGVSLFEKPVEVNSQMDAGSVHVAVVGIAP